MALEGEEDVGKIFDLDVKEKKKTSRSASKKASRRRGFKGAVTTPVDYLIRSEKKKYMANSEVNDTVISYEEFKKFNRENKKKILKNLLSKYTRSELAEKMGCKISAIHSLVYRLNLSGEIQSNNDYAGNVDVNETITFLPSSEIEYEMRCYERKLIGIFDSTYLVSRLINMAENLEEERKYKVKLIITEFS